MLLGFIYHLLANQGDQAFPDGRCISEIIFFIFAVPLLLTAQPASIEVSGDITAHTTWNADTVKVTGDLLVADDVTLTIETGTYIEFQGWYTLVVEGNSYPTTSCLHFQSNQSLPDM